jgi:YHS domain-containing protein
MTRDPVCNTEVQEHQARQRKLFTDYDGQTFYFCSSACKKAFDSQPAEYAAQIRWPEDWETQDTDQPYGG